MNKDVMTDYYRNNPKDIVYGARETGDFLLVNSTHLERHYGGDRIKHSHTPPTMREKP